MSTFEPRGPEQQYVIDATAPSLVVLGGAGTGKTVCALAAARAHLLRTTTTAHDRALFLSFSRAAVAHIDERAQGILGLERSRIDTSTFHALAYSIVRRFGALIGRPDPVLVSPARQRIRKVPGSVGYDDLIPMALEILRASPAVATHLQGRWGLVIVDEFQDTGDEHQRLVDALALGRRILLGDPDQCIYTFLADKGVRLQRVLDASATAGAENTVTLPEHSHRDPSQMIPAVARAIQRRDFTATVLRDAMDAGRLVVHDPVALDDEVAAIAAVVRDVRDEQMDVAVFTHHNDMLARLSDGLEGLGVEHEIAGLSDALAAALDAQSTMLRFASGGAAWAEVLECLAVFVTSAQRGRSVPQLALNILRGDGPSTLQAKLVDLSLELDNAAIDAALPSIANAHRTLELGSKSAAWDDAFVLVSTMHARAIRRLGPSATPQSLAHAIAAESQEAAYLTLTESVVRPRPVQLMNLYQTKGREADVTVVVLRDGDWFGDEGEPWPSTSRLLYVVFSRARTRIIVLPVGDDLHAAVRQLGALKA